MQYKLNHYANKEMGSMRWERTIQHYHCTNNMWTNFIKKQNKKKSEHATKISCIYKHTLCCLIQSSCSNLWDTYCQLTILSLCWFWSHMRASLPCQQNLTLSLSNRELPAYGQFCPWIYILLVNTKFMTTIIKKIY